MGSNINLKQKKFTSKSGKSIVLRYVEKDDAGELCRYINELSKEDTFVRFSGETIDLKDEEEYIDKQIKLFQNNDAVSIAALYNNRIIAYSTVDRNLVNKKRSLHTASMGISVAKDFREDGVGKMLMSTIIEEARINITGLKLIELTVFSTNIRAKALYKSLGFVEYSRLPGAILFHGEYIDEVRMYLNI